MATITGSSGNDVLGGTAVSDLYVGLSGFDTALEAAAGRDAVFSLDAQGRWVVSSPQGVDTLESIEAVQFTDSGVELGADEFRVNTGRALDQSQPVLTTLNDGSFLASWVTGKTVHAQRFDSAAVALGAEIEVPALGPQPRGAQHHEVVALPDGGYLIAAVVGDMSSYTYSWQGEHATYPWVIPVIAVLRFSSEGAFAGGWGLAAGSVSSGRFAPLPLSDVFIPTITALTDDNFLVTWTREVDGLNAAGFSGQAIRLDGSGAPLGAAFSLPEAVWGADVAPLPGGGYVLPSIGSGQVRVQHFEGTGARVGDPVQVGEADGARPALSVLSDGRYVVVWNVQVDGGFELLAQRMDSTGVPLGAPVPVNSEPLAAAAQLAVTAVDDGYVVAWTAQGETDKDIHARRFDGSGSPVGGETVVNTGREGVQQQAALAPLDDGGFVVAWMSFGPGDDGWDIHAQRFDASGAPLPSGHALQGDGSNNTLRFDGSEPVQLLGGDGDDVLQGGSGDDVLDGGAGSDTIVSSDLHSAVTWQVTADHELRVTGPASGSDAVRSVERLLAGGASIGIRYEPDAEVRLVADYDAPYAILQAPQAAVLLDGSSVVAWERHGTNAGIYVQRFDPGGTASGAVVRIDAWKADVAALEDGGYVLAWSFQPEPNGSAAIAAQRFDAAGTPVGSTVRVATDVGDPTQAPVIAALPEGGYAVAWVKAAYPAGSVVLTRQFDGSGLPISGETPVNASPGPFPGEQSIAVLRDGSYVITWTMGDAQTWPNEPGYDIYAQRFDSDGAPAGGQARVNASSSGHQLNSDVAALSDGGYVVTWMNYIYSDTGIKARRFDASGAPVGDEVLVNPSAPHSDASGPVVCALADGGYVIAWTVADGSGSGIMVQRFDAGDARVGTASRVNTTAAGEQTQPVLTPLDDGGYMVAWLSHDDASYGIDTQRFDANNLPEGHLALTGGAEDNVLRVTSAPEGVELIGGAGADILAGAGGWDVLSGGSGGDTFEFAASGNGVDTITDWGFGDRISVAGASFDGTVTAGNGATVALHAVEASTSAGMTTLYIGTDATPGAEVVIRLAGSFAPATFTLNGHLIEAPKGVVVSGRGHLVGTPDDDTLIGLHGVTRMEGGKGDDVYVLGNPNDRLIEATDGGMDEVRSEWSHVLGDHVERLVLTGDRASRGTGNDLDNVITGNAVRNVLTGGLGADRLTGGAGADLFVYRSVAESGVAPGTWDVILDFSSAEGDRIDLRGIDADPARPGKQGFTFIGSAPFSSADDTGQLRFNPGTHMLYASTDADPDAELAVELAGVTSLATEDLVL